MLLEKADSKRRLERLVIQQGQFRGILNSTSIDDRNDAHELKKLLGDDGFERFDTGAGGPGAILSDKDLEILTDRSDEAYTRTEKGLGQSGTSFLAVEAKRGGNGVI